MKVMHLLESRRFSGAENVVCQIIKMIDDESIEFVYCSRDGQIREALLERNIAFTPISKLSVNEVKRVIKEERPDIIHAHDMKACFIAVIAAGKIPVISHIHNNSFDSRGLSLKSLAFFCSALKIKHIFWVSESAFNGYAFHDCFKRKSEVLYNIIDIKALEKKMELDKTSYNYDVVYLGRLTTPKNPHRLISVLKKFVDIKPNVKIAVIGTGELENEIHNLAKELNITTNVTFFGFRNNPYKILHDAKLMIMTSLWEGTPMCVLEAMSLGVPVVSTPTDGVSYVVDDGETGYLSDDDDKLVECCLRICEDTALRAFLSKKTRLKAEQLMDISVYRSKIISAYNKATKGDVI